MRLLEVISGRVVAPGAAQIALTMSGNDSRTIRKVDGIDKIRLLAIWAKNQVAGIAEMYSPLLHDNQSALRHRVAIAQVKPLFLPKFAQPLQETDTLAMLLSGSAVAGDFEIMAALIAYLGPTADNCKFITPDQLKNLAVHNSTFETTHVTAAGGGYTGAVALNSGTGIVKNDKFYAITGYRINTLAAVVGYTGVDWGNVRLGGPGCLADPDVTDDWFVRLSDLHGEALIPVFAGVNIGGVSVDIATDENAGTMIVNTHVVELSNYA